MKPIFTLTFAAIVTLVTSSAGLSQQYSAYPSGMISPSSSANSSYFGPQYDPSMAPRPTAAGLYHPMFASTPMYQAADPEVPLPLDAGNLNGNTQGNSGGFGPTFQSAPPATLQTPELSLPAYQNDTTWNAFSPPAYGDPFLNPGYGQPGYAQPGSPYYGQPGDPFSPYGGSPSAVPQQGGYMYGANGPQPYRFGWQNRIDVLWMPDRTVTAPGGVPSGDHGIFGVDYELAFGTPFVPGWILNWTNEFAYRNWQRPTGIGLPSDLYRFGIDLEMETPQAGPFSISLGVTPSINTDFKADPWKEGFQLDGRGIVLMQLDQYWTLGLGAVFWDRRKDRVLPWAGLIYRDDYWEWQLMYPEARISVFLGNEAYWSKWAYIRAEYHVEAYGIETSFGGVTADNQVEMEDYRVLFGLKMDAGMYNWFIEGGYVFEREVTFGNGVPGYGVGSGFIGQIGLRF